MEPEYNMAESFYPVMSCSSLILKRAGSIWFRIVFYISGAFLVLHLFLPQEFNIAFIPLVYYSVNKEFCQSRF